ncbi:MAG: hypothetical protein M3253_00020, partial [Chloroflexota bacterium]|nr:hypothetical protein [Chloroflexota bacterium]
MTEAKNQAHREYRAALRRATDSGAVQAAVAGWLAEITRLNRAARLALSRGEQLTGGTSQLEADVRRLELTADASRITAESAAEAHAAARRALSMCHEATAPARTPATARGRTPGNWLEPVAGSPAAGSETPIAALLR